MHFFVFHTLQPTEKSVHIMQICGRYKYCEILIIVANLSISCIWKIVFVYQLLHHTNRPSIPSESPYPCLPCLVIIVRRVRSECERTRESALCYDILAAGWYCVTVASQKGLAWPTRNKSEGLVAFGEFLNERKYFSFVELFNPDPLLYVALKNSSNFIT